MEKTCLPIIYTYYIIVLMYAYLLYYCINTELLLLELTRVTIIINPILLLFLK